MVSETFRMCVLAVTWNDNLVDSASGSVKEEDVSAAICNVTVALAVVFNSSSRNIPFFRSGDEDKVVCVKQEGSGIAALD